MTFVIGKTNFKSEVCSGSSFPTEAMVWINEVDSAKNLKELQSSNSFCERKIPDFEVLDSKFRLLPRSCWEDQKAPQDNLFLIGRQFAYIIFDCFKMRVTGEALLDLNDEHQVGRSAKFQMKTSLKILQKSAPAHSIVSAGYGAGKRSADSYSPLKYMVRRFVEHKMRDNNFNARNGDRFRQEAATWTANPRGNRKGKLKVTSRD